MNDAEIDKILDNDLRLISPVLKPKNGTGIMHMDSTRLMLKRDIKHYAQKVVERELRDLRDHMHAVSPDFNNGKPYLINLTLGDVVNELDMRISKLKEENN